MSKYDIDSLIPKTTDLQVYACLIKVVEKASIENLSEAQLIDNIKELGDGAIKIAKKLPRFAALFKEKD